jgi:hypothetical protein
MTPASKKMLFTYLIIGVISMLSGQGCSSGLKYEHYSSKDPAINITMDYISGWLYSEHRGSYDSYAQVTFYEPPDRKEKVYKAGIIITVKDSAKVEVKPPTVEAYAEDLLAKRMKFKDAKVLSRSKVKLLETDGLDIELSYKTLDKLYNVDAKLIPVKERVIILKKDDKFYILRYQNTEEDFDRFSKAFSHIIKTLKLKEN